MEEKESMETEKERLEFERQKLDLEKQRFEFEKSKKSSPGNEDTINFARKNSPNILGIIGAIGLAVTPFLPWWQISSTASVLGNSATFSSSITGFEAGHGYLIITCAIAALFLSFIGNRYIFIPGGLAAIDALSVTTGVIHVSSNISGAAYYSHGDSGFGIGAICASVAGLVIIIAAFFQRTTVHTNNAEENSTRSSLDLQVWTKNNKYNIEMALLAIILLLDLVYNVGSGFGASSIYEFTNLTWRHLPIVFFIIGIALPVYLLWDLQLKRTFNVTIALVSFCMLIFLIESIMGGKTNFTNRAYSNRHSVVSMFLKYFFNIWLLSAVILDLWGKRNAHSFPTIVTKVKLMFNPVIVLAIPILVFFLNDIYSPSSQNRTKINVQENPEPKANVANENHIADGFLENIMPSGTDENGWSYADYIIPPGCKIDSVYADFTRPGYSNSDKDFSVEFCRNTPTFIGSTAEYPFKYEEVEASLYQFWLDFSSLNYSAPGVLRVRLPTNAGAVWNNLKIKLSHTGQIK